MFAAASAYHVVKVMEMNWNLFEQAAAHAMQWAPDEPNLLIIPVESLRRRDLNLNCLPRYPVLYVTGVGYVPLATKREILRRRNPNLFLLGDKKDISEWVAYVLSTLTSGGVYRLIIVRAFMD